MPDRSWIRCTSCHASVALVVLWATKACPHCRQPMRDILPPAQRGRLGPTTTPERSA
ncbi:MAG TPA: hypothetical protein VHB30_07025 [Solirubrobacteraceae bacterium]|nr:hypothetical protein [Solirubrobacteraceae bacterium]